MIQPCDTHGSGKNESAYLPYATGLLIAYAFKNKTVKENYCIKRFIYRKEDISAAISSMEAPAVVGFSTYIWNYEYNKAFASELKKKYPDCLIIFGGHSILNTSSEQLEECPYIDILIHGEGELPFREILFHSITDGELSSVANISFRDKNGIIIKTPVSSECITDFPSPYLEGYFDDILRNDNLIFSALLETNRGCPFRCAYCDWGSIRCKLRFLPLEKIAAEIRWFADHKIQFCYCTDSNFGMFDRDYEIVDTFYKIRSETGFPEKFQCCTTKGSGLQEYSINKKLADCDILKGVSIALQTLSPEALRNINRSNISFEHYGKLVKLYNEAGLPTYCEFIYALPGETYDSFADNISRLLDIGNTKSCFTHFFELLKNSELGSPENIEKYKLVTARIPYTQFHSQPEKNIREYSDIVISTYSMTYSDWVKTVIFNLFIQGFHFIGGIRFIAQYIHFGRGLSYRTFYEKLILYAESHPDNFIGNQYSGLYSKLSAKDRGETISRVFLDPRFGNIEFPLEEGLALSLVADPDAFYSDLLSFFRSEDLLDDFLCELIRYQRFLIRLPGDTEKTDSFEFNFPFYLRQIEQTGTAQMTNESIHVRCTNTFRTETLEDYAREIIWYGRKSCRLLYGKDEMTVF